MEQEKNISGISENLSESITDQKPEKVNQKSLFDGMRIAISVSASEEIEKLGLSDQHLDDVSIEIARYLIVNGATLLYGGDFKKGFTDLFSTLAYQYKYLNDKVPRFENYIHFLNVSNVSNTDKADLLSKQVVAKYLDVPEHLKDIKTHEITDPRNNLFDRYITGESLSLMRIKMANESDARIILGGRLKGFTGYFPGIVEETYHTLNANKPVYLLGGFGGASKAIIEIILGNSPLELTNEFQFDTPFLKEFRNYCNEKSSVKPDYEGLCNFFKKYSVELISKQNGLTIEENKILFESTNIHELVFLIIKGLQNLKVKR